jgi:hypothetical protein
VRLFRRHAGVDFESLRPVAAVAADVGVLAARFASERRAAVEDLLPRDLAVLVASALPGLPLSRVSPDPRGLGGTDPGYMYYEAPVRPHEGCRRDCAPVCALALSLEGGPLRDFLRVITGHSGLHVGGVSVRAYVKGSHVSRSAGAEVLWYATPGWGENDGGLLRFPGGERWLPRFGAMHVVEGDPREVTLVPDHSALYVVRALLRTG